jgi:hypothetical protein
MNDIYEIWSLPWHALQKNLAKGIGAQEAAGGSAFHESERNCRFTVWKLSHCQSSIEATHGQEINPMSSLDERHEDNAPKDRLGDAELSAELLERRWFAAMAAVKSLQDDCDALLRVVERAENNWLRTCAQVALVESLRDALGEQLAARDGARATTLEANTQPPIYVGQQPQRSDHQEL